MSDRGNQERAKQQKPDGYETQKQKPAYSGHQSPHKAPKQQQPQPMNQPDASANKQNNNDTRIQGNYAYATQGQAPRAYNAAGAYPQQQYGNQGTYVYATQGQAPPPAYAAAGGYPQQQQQHVVIIRPATNYNSPNSGVTDASTPWAESSFSDKKIRQAFIRKVYLILTALLLVTLVFICIFLFVAPVKQWVHHHSWFLWVSFGVYFAICLVLMCCTGVARTYPCNYICLVIFNLAFSYVLAAISSYYSTMIVLIAIGISALVCVSVSIFAIQTRIDFTMCAGLFFVLSMVLLIFGIVVVIVGLVAGGNYILTCVYGACAALVFTLFLAYDTQLVIGNRRYQLSPEDYIIGALTLYLDVGTLYMIILSFFGNS